MSIYGIPQSTLYRWLKDYRQFVERLRIENSLLKSAKCSVQAPLSVKLPEMIRLQKETNCSVYMLCKAFDVRKSTYYHRVLRSPDVTQHEAEDEALKSVVKTVFDESKGRFGSAMIKAKMDERGAYVATI